MISLSVILLVLGLIAGLARGGKLSNIAAANFEKSWLVFVGLAIQISAELYAFFVDGSLGEGGRGITILAFSYIFLIAFVILNRKLPGAWLIAAGLGLNLLVIVPNGGMPVSLRAAAIAGFDPSELNLDIAVKHDAMGPDTVFGFLGDVIPMPFIKKVVSIGDLVLGVGVFLLIERLVRYSPKRLRPSGEVPVSD